MRYVGDRWTDSLDLMHANATSPSFPLDRQWSSTPARAKYVLLAGGSWPMLEKGVQSPACFLAFCVLGLGSEYNLFLRVVFADSVLLA